MQEVRGHKVRLKIIVFHFVAKPRSVLILMLVYINTYAGLAVRFAGFLMFEILVALQKQAEIQ